MITSTDNIRQIAKSCLLCWARGQIETMTLMNTLKAASSVPAASEWMDFEDCVGLVLARVERHDITFDEATLLLSRIARA